MVIEIINLCCKNFDGENLANGYSPNLSVAKVSLYTLITVKILKMHSLNSMLFIRSFGRIKF